MTQSLPNKPEFKPFDIPVAVGLIGKRSRKPLLVKLKDSELESNNTVVLRLTEREKVFVFENVSEEPIPSLFRNFSAPVKVTCKDISRDDLSILASFDTDEFNRYEAGQELASQVMLELINAVDEQEDVSSLNISNILKHHNESVNQLIEVFKEYLCDDQYDNSLKAMSINLPTESLLAELLPAGTVNAESIYLIQNSVKKEIATALQDELMQVFLKHSQANDNDTDAGIRSIKNKCLEYLMISARASLGIFNPKTLFYSEIETETLMRNPHAKKVMALVLEQFKNADNMTDTLAALIVLASIECPQREQSFVAFYERFKDDPLVKLKWLTLQARSNSPKVIDRIKDITSRNDVFQLTNPNQVYSLVRGFANNWIQFHRPDGKGYEFVADFVLELDSINPQVASRVVGTITDWKKYTPERGNLMKAQLKRLSAVKLSDDVYEKVSKALDVNKL